MLKCYPIEATRENWLHDAMTSLVRLVHQKLDEGELIANDQATWVRLIEIAVPEDKGNVLGRLTGIRDRLFVYKDEASKLNVPQRDSILTVMDSQNAIKNLLNGSAPVQLINKTNPGLHEKVKELFVFCFEKLGDLNVRERQYKVIFESLSNKICPFCGIERVMNPEETAQDQDHYLAKSLYPFAAVNMRNLVPMCRCCNRDYKKDSDVIADAAGVRRTAFDPYDCKPPIMSLTPSTLIPNSSPMKFNWEIDFLSELEACETWDQVFSIRKRYKRDVLDQYFDKWLRGFTSKCMKDRSRGIIRADLTSIQIREQLQFYQEDKSDNPSIGLAGFLEPLAFSFLLKMYDEGDERIVNLIRDAVLGISLDDVA